MTLRYENKTVYQGYSQDTILTFCDDELEEEMYPSFLKILSNYDGGNGEVVDIKLIYNKERKISQIFLIIICFRTLLSNISEYKYSKFIDNHKTRFTKFYQRAINDLIE